MLHNTRHKPLPCKPYPRSKRPGKRRRVTLIAAFRCKIENEEGVIICADSQESFGDYRVTVDKIKPRDANLYDLCFGGAGQIGDLIDALGNAIEREIKRWKKAYSEDEARVLLENEILLFNSRQVEAYPAQPEDKVIQFIICLRDKASHAIYLWKVSGSTIEPIVDHDLIGWGEPFYKYEAKRLYRNVTNAPTAIAAGLHLLTFGKGTATSIDKPFRVIGVSPTQGMWFEPEDTIEKLETKVSGVNETVSRLITLAPDVNTSEEAFKKALELFEQEIRGLRKETKHYVLATATGRFNLTGYPVHPFTTSVEPVFVPESPHHNPDTKKSEESAEPKNES
jgi:hypothetical protein